MGFSSRRIEEREKKHCLHTCYSNLFNVFFFLFSRRIDERENIVSTPIIQISSMFSSFSSRGESMKKKEHCLHTCYSNLFNAFFFLFSRRINERENIVSTPIVQISSTPSSFSSRGCKVEEETNRGGKKS